MEFSCNLGWSNAESQFMFKTNGTSFCDRNRLLVFIVDKESARQKLPSLKGTKMRESLGRSGEIKGKALIGPLPPHPTIIILAVLPRSAVEQLTRRLIRKEPLPFCYCREAVELFCLHLGGWVGWEEWWCLRGSRQSRGRT